MNKTFGILLTAAVSSILPAQGWSPISETATFWVNSSATDGAPSLSSDGLTLYYMSNRVVTPTPPISLGFEIYSATRPARSLPWGMPTHELVCSSTAADEQPFITADGLELWFSSTRTGGSGGGDLMRVTRTSTMAPWSPPSFVAGLNSTGIDTAPTLTSDLTEVYFLSTGFGNPSSFNNSIFVAKRTSSSAPFGAPQLVTELFDGNTHRDVHISGDGLAIWYSEYMPAPVGGHRIRKATRFGRNLPFGTPANVNEFNDIGWPVGPYGLTMSHDGTEMILDVGGSSAVTTLNAYRHLQTSRFSGCTTAGIASPSSFLEFRIRDGLGGVRPYVLVLSMGNTGFFANSHFVPVNPDSLFIMTLGVDVPPFTLGFAGYTDADGIGVGTIVDPTLGTLAGNTLYATGATLDPLTFGISLIGNAVSFQFQP